MADLLYIRVIYNKRRMKQSFNLFSKYQYLFFDLDGTVTYPMQGITRSVAYALNHFGIVVNDLRELCPFIGPPFFYRVLSVYGSAGRRGGEEIPGTIFGNRTL